LAKETGKVNQPSVTRHQLDPAEGKKRGSRKEEEEEEEEGQWIGPREKKVEKGCYVYW